MGSLKIDGMDPLPFLKANPKWDGPSSIFESKSSAVLQRDHGPLPATAVPLHYCKEDSSPVFVPVLATLILAPVLFFWNYRNNGRVKYGNRLCSAF